MSKKHFDPNWSDTELDLGVVDIPLFLPEETERKATDRIWIKRKVVFSENFCEKTIKLSKPRTIVFVLRKSNAANRVNCEITNKHNKKIEKVEQNSSLYDLIFPPRAFMSNSLQEKTMMYNAAKLAKGDILVGGLGLGVYPQLVLFLNRPVSSITIIEKDQKVIDLIGVPLLKVLKDNNVELKIINDSIEDYMISTDKSYNTIYLDTWDDLHFKFLPYINYLVSLAQKIVTGDGVIHCWGYNHMYKDFIETAQTIEKYPESLDKLIVDDNILLKEYLIWRRQLPEAQSIKKIIKHATKMATELCDDTPIELSIDIPMSRYKAGLLL